MKVKLTIAELDYLTLNNFLPEKFRNRIASQCKRFENRAALELTDEDADNLRDACGERLAYAGFDKDYELTNEGKILEDLIDKLFIG